MFPARFHQPIFRAPGESSQIYVIDRPSQFDGMFDRFVAEMGPYKVIGMNFKMDNTDGNGKKNSTKAARARRRRQRQQLQRMKNRYGGDANQGSSQMQFNAIQTQQFSAMAQFDAVDNGNGGANENYDEDLDENGDGIDDEEEEPYEKTEEDDCEEARQKCLEYSRVALISMSTIHGTTLIIRTCRFPSLPQKLVQMIEGKEFLKIGFGLKADKTKFYDKYSHFVSNFVDPRRPLFAWSTFVEKYHFERFGVHSVASHLFNDLIQNTEAAASLGNSWAAPKLNPCLHRAAARETQLTIDVYAEMCIQMLGRRGSMFFMAADAPKEPEFFDEILKVSENHINHGFDMKAFGVQVFSTPALQRRFRRYPTGFASGNPYSNGENVGDVVPQSFADRVRLRRSKSSVEKYWKTSMLYASFDVALFSRQSTSDGPVVYYLFRNLNGVVWEMKIEIISKIGQRPPEFMQNVRPAVGHYTPMEPVAEDTPPEDEDDYTALGLGQDWRKKLSVQQEQPPEAIKKYWEKRMQQPPEVLHKQWVTHMQSRSVVNVGMAAAPQANNAYSSPIVPDNAFNGQSFSPAYIPIRADSLGPALPAGRGRGRITSQNSSEATELMVPGRQPPFMNVGMGRGRIVKLLEQPFNYPGAIEEPQIANTDPPFNDYGLPPLPVEPVTFDGATMEPAAFDDPAQQVDHRVFELEPVTAEDFISSGGGNTTKLDASQMIKLIGKGRGRLM